MTRSTKTPVQRVATEMATPYKNHECNSPRQRRQQTLAMYLRNAMAVRGLLSPYGVNNHLLDATTHKLLWDVQAAIEPLEAKLRKELAKMKYETSLTRLRKGTK